MVAREPSPTAGVAAADEPPEVERPAFARAFPRDPELDALVSAFEAGDYARVREEAPKLALRAESPEIARAAHELRSRIEPDPIALYLVALTAALLLFLSAWFVWHAR